MKLENRYMIIDRATGEPVAWHGIVLRLSHNVDVGGLIIDLQKAYRKLPKAGPLVGLATWDELKEALLDNEVPNLRAGLDMDAEVLPHWDLERG